MTGTMLRFRRLAFRNALNLLHNRADAEDAVQEAMCRALEHEQTFDHTRRVLPWFLKIVRNTCLSELTRRGRFAVDIPDAPSGECVEAAVVAAEYARECSAAMQRLRPAYRTALELRLRNCNYAEIARELGVPFGTAQTLVYRARRQLRSMVD